MREKILNLLRNKKINIDGQLVPVETPEELTTEIISTLIESLPEEKNEFPLTKMMEEYNIKQGYPADFCPPDEKARGFNTYRSEVINLLRGTK